MNEINEKADDNETNKEINESYKQTKKWKERKLRFRNEKSRKTEM